MPRDRSTPVTPGNRSFVDRNRPALLEQELLTLYRPDLAQALAAASVPAYRYTQVLEHLFRRPLASFAQATALPGEWREQLDQLGASTLDVTAERTAPDGTKKFLLRTRDGHHVESVLMTYRDRVTACISSQIGCPVGCAFCATGTLGFKRNLTVAEIVDQVRLAAREAAASGRRLSNLVYMGMGEPLLNVGAVLDSIRILTDPRALGLGHRSISVSTIGIPRGILRLATVEPQVNLALSLQAADDRTRALLIPDKFRHPLAEILEACWRHFRLTHRKLLVEYLLLGSLNDSPGDARRLARLLRGHVVTVNLIPWNPVSAPDGRALQPLGQPASAPATRPARAGQRPARGRTLSFTTPTPAALAAFRQILVEAGVETVVRESKGASIEAACGQLAGRVGSYS